MNNEELITLFERYRNNQCTAEEADRLIRHIKSGRDWQLVEELIGRISPDEITGDAPMQASLDRVFQQVQEAKRDAKPSRTGVRKLPWRWAAAAAVIIGVTVAVWNAVETRGRKPTAIDLKVTDITPGGNRATLTLADGRAIALSEVQSGIVVDGDRIIYEDGSEPLTPEGSGLADPSAKLVLTTPKGGMYQVTLPDNTKIWLNAASSLTYPARFARNERRVILSGEAYFDVAPDKNRPFRVESRDQEVEVLGTEFNVSAYPDEAYTKTTLVEGVVQLGSPGTKLTLRPGEQGTVATGEIRVEAIDVAAFVGWRSGEFIFDGIALQDAMKQLARWYDLEVVYEGTIPETRFYGSFSRLLPLSEALVILKEANVGFSIRRNGSVNQLVIHP